MSKHTDKYPEFDGSGDWKTWTGGAARGISYPNTHSAGAA